MNITRQLKKISNFLINTPIHPQWLLARHDKYLLSEIGKKSNGIIVDIGAGKQKILNHITSKSAYIPIDYYTTSIGWYQHQPAIYATAEALPLQDSTADIVLLLDVLEHLPNPELSLLEIKRILKPTGTAIIKVPFMYPIHDAPYDFSRFTEHGLLRRINQAGLECDKITWLGTPIETGSLLINIALAKSLADAIQEKSWLTLLNLAFALLILPFNLLGLIGSIMRTRKSDWMPHTYIIQLKKCS